jgi:hypothetical protein
MAGWFLVGMGCSNTFPPHFQTPKPTQNALQTHFSPVAHCRTNNLDNATNQHDTPRQTNRGVSPRPSQPRFVACGSREGA